MLSNLQFNRMLPVEVTDGLDKLTTLSFVLITLEASLRFLAAPTSNPSLSLISVRLILAWVEGSYFRLLFMRNRRHTSLALIP